MEKNLRDFFRQAISLNGDSIIDLGSDSITETVRDVVNDTAATIGLGNSLRTRHYVYKPGSSAPVLANTSWRAVDGRTSRSESFGRHTRWEYALTNTTGKRGHDR